MASHFTYAEQIGNMKSILKDKQSFNTFRKIEVEEKAEVKEASKITLDPNADMTDLVNGWKKISNDKYFEVDVEFSLAEEV